MKKLMQHFPTTVVAILFATLLFTQTAIAQDASQTALQNAQTSQQATYAAQQAAQQAQQQAMQNAMDAASASANSGARPQLPSSVIPTGPIPAQIATAHTVFLTNAGADANFPVDENTAYTDIVSALQRWGRYQLVSSPQEADLIFSLRDIAPISGVSGYHGTVYSTDAPAFQLTILDAKTNAPLWTITSPVLLAGHGKTYARWYALAVNNLISRIKVLAQQPLTPQETVDLTIYPQHHTVRNVIIFGLAIGAATATFVSIGLAHQKSSQDAFCNAHGIPLSMCAGG